MQEIKFRMAATSDCGGRPNKPNEDNFQADDDLSDGQWQWTTDKECILTPKGALLVVSDGMGGMNAGDVASSIAIQTIKEFFDTTNINDSVLKSDESIVRFMEKAIEEADKRIKEEGNRDAEKEGMGATIVIAWILSSKAYIGWCGDSRAYLYNPVIGLKQVSKDHSYVQDLVDSGQLKPELAFDHPNSNIITRSLGDPSKKAKPDFKVIDLFNDDVIMLCSDGLSGVLRDQMLEAVISQHLDSMKECQVALFDAACNADWSDNTTVALCQILSGGQTRKPLHNEKTSTTSELHSTSSELTQSFFEREKKKYSHQIKKKNCIIFSLLVVMLLLLCVGGYFWWQKRDKKEATTLVIEPKEVSLNAESSTSSIQITANKKWDIKKDTIWEEWIKVEKKNDSTLNISIADNTKDTILKFDVAIELEDTTATIKVHYEVKDEQEQDQQPKAESEPKEGNILNAKQIIQEESDWKKACKEKKHKEYLDKYPNGKYSQAANDSIKVHNKDILNQVSSYSKGEKDSLKETNPKK